MRAIVGGLLAGLVATTTLAQETSKWLCIADAATGFSFDAYRKSWSVARFEVESQKYILQRPEKGFAPNVLWVVTQLGKSSPEVYCAAEFSDDELSCRGLTKFEFSKKTLRFQKIYDLGYVSPAGTEGDDTPVITIGRCSPL